MPDVCFSCWFRVIDFMIRRKPVLLFCFLFLLFLSERSLDFLCNIGQLTLISQFVWLLLCIYVYCIFVNLSTLNKLLNKYEYSKFPKIISIVCSWGFVAGGGGCGSAGYWVGMAQSWVGACFKLGNGPLCGFPLRAPWDLYFQGAMGWLYWSEMG